MRTFAVYMGLAMILAATLVYLFVTHTLGALGSLGEKTVPVAVGILLVFVALFVALLPILRRMTGQLIDTNGELRRRTRELDEILAQRERIEQRLRETIADLERSEEALAHSQEEAILRLSIAVETRDRETGDHIERMGRYCALLANKLGWNDEECDLLRTAAPLHDVGKIAIPDSILLKPGALTPDERVEIERHAEIGHEILAGSESPLLDLAAKIALSHHEHWDGGGYPNGLAGQEIPVEGRMAAIADVFDALTSDRVYRQAMTVEKALAIMADGRGTNFDPDLLDVFFDAIGEVLEIRTGHLDEQRQHRGPRPARQRRIQHQEARSAAAAAAGLEKDGRPSSMVG
jgi:HD-GYP domain-containing protein (c-di-GMP phosphodiesterase class II)